MEIDHLAVTCADLDEGAAWVGERLGAPLEPGGSHRRFGTRNRLLSLGPGLYLEVIAPEPGTAPAAPRWFGLDGAGAPALAHWIVRVPDLDAALAESPPESGEALALSRGDLRWRAAVPPDGSLPWGGAFPTLIEWEGGHPADRLPDRGLRLLGLEVGHPRAPRLRELLGPLADPRLSVVTADAPGLRATFATPGGGGRAVIRPAAASDAPALWRIWTPVIRDTTAIFHTAERSEEEIAALTEAGDPFLVWEQAGEPLGFARCFPFRAGNGYAHAVEHTILLAPAARGKGGGRALMEALFEDARARDKHTMWGAVSAENAGALAFHRACGFVEHGRLPQVGRKFGRWLDLVLMGRLL